MYVSRSVPGRILSNPPVASGEVFSRLGNLAGIGVVNRVGLYEQAGLVGVLSVSVNTGQLDITQARATDPTQGMDDPDFQLLTGSSLRVKTGRPTAEATEPQLPTWLRRLWSRRWRPEPVKGGISSPARSGVPAHRRHRCSDLDD